MGGAKDIRVATRNQLILLMMHFAGRLRFYQHP